MIKSIVYSSKDENDAWELYKKEVQQIKESAALKNKNSKEENNKEKK